MARPLKFETHQEMESLINLYFANCPDTRQIRFNDRVEIVETPTITGLALFLGFSSRQSLYDYAAKSNDFKEVINLAKSKMECEYEKNLNVSGAATGAIFALKNFGWSDKQEIETTVTGYNLFEEKVKQKAKKVLNDTTNKKTAKANKTKSGELPVDNS